MEVVCGEREQEEWEKEEPLIIWEPTSDDAKNNLSVVTLFCFLLLFLRSQSSFSLRQTCFFSRAFPCKVCTLLLCWPSLWSLIRHCRIDWALLQCQSLGSGQTRSRLRWIVKGTARALRYNQAPTCRSNRFCSHLRTLQVCICGWAVAVFFF